MLLSELQWSLPRGQMMDHTTIISRWGGQVSVYLEEGCGYSFYLYKAGAGGTLKYDDQVDVWRDLDPISAQAVLFYLTCEGNDDCAA
jgi:hypothetical protein